MGKDDKEKQEKGPPSTKDVVREVDKAFLRRALRYFGISHVVLAYDPSTPDIAVMPHRQPPIILLGKKWARDGTRERHKKLVHELIHILGYPHNEKMRTLGYFSEPSRDTLSWGVYWAIQRGHRRFDPIALGLPPSEEGE